jgi:DNA-directed RNA polymerase subunit RPC12/RpoP
MLTCDCGARFEVEDTLAGQEVACPECQQPVKVPPRTRAAPRTSAYALASVVVALVGAFTPASLVAVALGAYALLHIARHRERVAGTGFAVFGIILGLAFGTLFVLSISEGELFGLGGWMREHSPTATPVDTSGPLEIVRRGYAITRPSEKWGQVRSGRLDDPVVGGMQQGLDLLLLQAARNSFVDVKVQPDLGGMDLDRWQQQVMDEFQPRPRQPFRQRFPIDDEDDDVPAAVPTRAKVLESKRLPEVNGVEGREVVLDVRRAGQPWRFVIRLYRPRFGPVYVVRAYAQSRRFLQVESELRQALDSFRILPGR